MDGIGPPLVTPFDEDGRVDYDRLRDLVGWVEERGVDFLVPCGSNSEAELMTAEERRTVIETVVEEASVPVLAGTGNPGLRETVAATEAADEAGVDAALVVTPFYYEHDQETLSAYYRELADTVSLPVYLYSVPAYTGVALEPETVGELATHENIVGIKDSSGSLSRFVRTERRVEDSFDLLVGSGGVLVQALAAGASGGVLALANLLPEQTTEVFETYDEKPEWARVLNANFVDLNTAVTSTYGVPGLKWAMRQRGAPAGFPRSPHRFPESDAKDHIEALLADVV